jgi:isochorismatase family protein
MNLSSVWQDSDKKWRFCHRQRTHTEVGIFIVPWRMIMNLLSARAALVVIDVQQGFSDPSWGSRNNAGAEANIGHLLAAWRKSGRPVVHVHHDSVSPNGSFVPGTVGNAPKVEAVPLEGEPVHHKTVNSGFIGTRLEQDLRAAGIDTCNRWLDDPALRLDNDTYGGKPRLSRVRRGRCYGNLRSSWHRWAKERGFGCSLCCTERPERRVCNRD